MTVRDSMPDDGTWGEVTTPRPADDGSNYRSQLTGLHEQLRPAGFAALQREVDEVRPRVDCDGVGLGREKCLTERRQAVGTFAEDRDDAALC
jgi:hypothetical protein